MGQATVKEGLNNPRFLRRVNLKSLILRGAEISQGVNQTFLKW